MLGTDDPEKVKTKTTPPPGHLSRPGGGTKTRWRPIKKMKQPWRYFNQMAATPAGTVGYADDLIVPAAAWDCCQDENARAPAKRKPGTSANNHTWWSDPHGADRHRISRSDALQENIGDLVNQESPETAASTKKDGMKNVRLDSVRKRKGSDPIKAARQQRASSVSPRAWIRKATKMDRIAQSYKSPSRPRRWLAGAPGGWWPSSLENTSSDEEDCGPATTHLPFKKRKIFRSSRTDAGASSDSSIRCEPQPSFPSQGDASPRETWPMLPHGPPLPDSTDDANNDCFERSFGSLSTLAIASDEDDREAPSSSSSAYGSGSDGRAGTAAVRKSATEIRGPTHAPTAPLKIESEGMAPAARLRRRTRRERAERNANWSRSVTPHTAAIIIDIASSSEDETVCSESVVVTKNLVVCNNSDKVRNSDKEKSLSDTLVHSETRMPIDVQVYRALCRAYEETLHPVDGDALLDYVQGFVTLEKEAIRLRNYRLRKKNEREQQRQQEALLNQDTANIAAAPAARARAPKRKKTTTPLLRKKKKLAEAATRPAADATEIEQAATQAGSLQPALSPPAMANNDGTGEMMAERPNGAPIQPCTAPAIGGDFLAPVQTFTADLDRVATSTPLAVAPGPSDAALTTTSEAGCAYIISPAAIARGPSLDLDIASFLESLPPLPSPAATLQPLGTERLCSGFSPLGLADLNETINSMQMPPTPATPEHLRSTETATAGLRAQLLSPVPGAPHSSIRMRIVRRPLDELSTAAESSA
ncbi:hypothetical protein QAD02_009526 [Eretmocerus hayati]|uniref:Uncharacterized protein n=1 Tax=Eretmocerus hayati TaxID=131215 RepID=A0ACC2NAV4_9HYME|nr:hypothetical protein QAD02_009526 [Eretmocerus hayati]